MSTSVAPVGATPTAKRGLFAVALLVVLAAVTGCHSDLPPRPDTALNQAEVHKAARAAEQLPGVLRADGHYETGITGYGRTLVSVTVPAGTPPARVEELLDELERLIWRSAIDPVNVLGVSVVEEGHQPGQRPVGDRLYQGEDRVARLESKYGPRPPMATP